MQQLIEEVVELVRARMPGQGRTASALPGLYLYRWDAPQTLTPGRTHTMRVNLCVQGRKLMRVDGAEHYYDPVSYLVLRGETAFEACAVEASRAKPYLAIALELSPQLVSQALLEIVQAGHVGAESEDPPSAFTAPLDAPLLNGMSRLLRALEDPVERAVLGPLVVRELVLRLLLSNAASVMRAGTLGQQEREPIRRAMEFIDQRAFERLSVDAIARHVGMSPSHFAHRFSAIASVSPMRYLKHVRLERARQLLLAAERASTVASQVGYASEAHFNRDFKRQFGLAPVSYVRAFERGAFAMMDDAIAGSSKKNAEPALGRMAAAR
ncbi:MAG TPA: AraC family transcriptional regulator [Polyangiales bacterium]|nr:AraC family transcriptional regulator [Polyangiales bacterium]